MNNRQKRDKDGFYVVMDEYYGVGSSEKHESPTKRLISLKNSTSEHKKIMKNQIQRGEYSLTYCSSPGKSYIIEPHGGELNYKIAEKNPLKFYDQVFNQDITKHKVKEQQQEEEKTRRRPKVAVTSKVTKRPYLKIMQKIKIKLIETLLNRIGEEHLQDINIAVKDKEIEQTIKMMMGEDKIKLLNSRNEPVYQKQILEAAAFAD